MALQQRHRGPRRLLVFVFWVALGTATGAGFGWLVDNFLFGIAAGIILGLLTPFINRR